VWCSAFEACRGALPLSLQAANVERGQESRHFSSSSIDRARQAQHAPRLNESREVYMERGWAVECSGSERPELA